VSDETERRLIFGSVAEQYDRHRPGYPDVLVDEVLAYTGVSAFGGPQATTALEVGGGTGKATRLFAARGLDVTVLEPDPEMLAINHSRADLENLDVNFQLSDFEHAEFEPHSFQLVYSATAWHWVTPELRYELAAQALRKGGALATFWNRPAWQDTPLRRAFDEAYASVAEAFDAVGAGPMYPAPGVVVLQADELTHELSGRSDFGDVQISTHRWTVPYGTAEYLALLGTHSDHILIGEAARERLFAGIAAAIEANGGAFEMTYEALLCLARAL